MSQLSGNTKWSVAKLKERSPVRWHERIGETSIFIISLASILLIMLMAIFILKEGLMVFINPSIRAEVNFRELFLKTVWQPISEVPKYSLLPLIAGTLKTSFVALLIALPLGMLAALFISECAPKWLSEFVKPTIELLAAIPSVVIGFFCLMKVASWLAHAYEIKWLHDALTPHRLNTLVGGIGISIAVVPITFTLCEEAFHGVPESYRAASIALGATKWQTALGVVIPTAMPGVIAAILLSFGRAWGETMIALMATGNAPLLDLNILHSVRTLAATVGAEMPEVVVGSSHYHVLFLIGTILLSISFTVNGLSQLAISSLRKKLTGG
ncbi:MAG: phosphate ABC transporter permease subunit PstC [Armatimonadota bacterium]|nr:phosphate ABC transporter permease subunit PstC [Armatimonadota bacterium]MCX7777700.1 phosphate ABC transporter permease subunit PstC [Armatimonadota bacterium]MDW8025459.1 phosphate ABC transporter permease subunit PstC [Armatimonadota bacterium]